MPWEPMPYLSDSEVMNHEEVLNQVYVALLFFKWTVTLCDSRCMFYCFRMLQGSSNTDGSENDGGPQFAEVFVVYWLGATVVTLNIKLLGGSMYVWLVLKVFISPQKCRQSIISQNSPNRSFSHVLRKFNSVVGALLIPLKQRVQPYQSCYFLHDVSHVNV